MKNITSKILAVIFGSMLFLSQNANAALLDFSAPYDPSNPSTPIDELINLGWDDDRLPADGYLHIYNPISSYGGTWEAIIRFDAPQNVLSLDLHGHKFAYDNYNSVYDSNIVSILANGIKINDYDLSNYNDLDMTTWLHIDFASITNVDYLTFIIDKESFPSIDNLNVEPVPIPGAVWLLGSGLLGMVAIRRKSNK